MENGDNSEAWCYWWQKVVMNNDVVPFKVAYFSLFQFSLPLREWESVETQLRPLGNATLVACLLLHWQPRCSNVLVVRASDWYIFRRSWVRILAGIQKFFHEFISHSLGTVSLLFHFLKQRAAVAIQRENTAAVLGTLPVWLFWPCHPSLFCTCIFHFWTKYNITIHECLLLSTVSNIMPLNSTS